MTVASASTLLKQQYKCGGGSITVAYRWLAVYPAFLT
jgi:hypothetical protein